MPNYTFNLQGVDNATITIKDEVINLSYSTSAPVEVSLHEPAASRVSSAETTIDLSQIKKHILKLADKYGKLQAIAAVRDLVPDIGLKVAKETVEEWLKHAENEKGFLDQAMEQAKKEAYAQWTQDRFHIDVPEPTPPPTVGEYFSIPNLPDYPPTYDGCKCQSCIDEYERERFWRDEDDDVE